MEESDGEKIKIRAFAHVVDFRRRYYGRGKKISLLSTSSVLRRRRER